VRRKQPWLLRQKQRLPGKKRWLREEKRRLPRKKQWLLGRKQRLLEKKRWLLEEKGWLPEMKRWLSGSIGQRHLARAGLPAGAAVPSSLVAAVSACGAPRSRNSSQKRR
jgi:hypothetical protein